MEWLNNQWQSGHNFILSAVDMWEGERIVINTFDDGDTALKKSLSMQINYECSNFYNYSVFKLNQKVAPAKKPKVLIEAFILFTPDCHNLF